MRLIQLVLVAFVVGLGAAIAYRLSTEALAVIVGAVIGGLMVGIPLTLIALYAARRRPAAPPEPAPWSPPPPAPAYSPAMPYLGYGQPLTSPQLPAPPPQFVDHSRLNVIPYDLED